MIDETGGPTGECFGFEHLREEERALGVAGGFVAAVRPAGVEPPEPEGDDDHVANPEGDGGAEQVFGMFLVGRESEDEQSE